MAELLCAHSSVPVIVGEKALQPELFVGLLVYGNYIQKRENTIRICSGGILWFYHYLISNILILKHDLTIITLCTHTDLGSKPKMHF